MSAMLAGVKPVTVIPFAVELALMDELQETASAVAYVPAVGGFAVTLKEQCPPAVMDEHDAVEPKPK